MDYVTSLQGNTTPLKKLYQIGEAMANVGVPVLVGGSNNEGIALAGTAAAVDLMGVTVDAQATLVTAQQSDNSDPRREVTVIVDPSAIYKAKLTQGSAEDTALTLFDVTTASSDGLVVTTGDEWSSPTYDEGTLWGYDGANVGIVRKITSVSSTAATMIVALPNDTVVGDNFMRAPFNPGEAQFVQLSTLLTQIDASVAVDTDNNNFRVLEILARDQTRDGRNNSFALIVGYDSMWAAGASV